MIKRVFDKNFRDTDLKEVVARHEKDGVMNRAARIDWYNRKVKSYMQAGLVTKTQSRKWSIPSTFIN